MENKDIEAIKKELDDLAERGVPFKACISFLTGRYYMEESIPMELLEYALNLPKEITIIGNRKENHSDT